MMMMIAASTTKLNANVGTDLRWIGNFEAEFGLGMDDFGVDEELFLSVTEGPDDGSWSSDEKEARDGRCWRRPEWCVGAEAKLNGDKRSSETADSSSFSVYNADELITAGDDILRTFA